MRNLRHRGNRGHSRVAVSVAGLSAVHLITQALAAGAQFVLAIWLLPADFGLWATATAWTALLLGLANFGEVNGYLSNPHAGLRDSVKRTLPPNLVLAGVALCLAMSTALQGHGLLAWLLFFCGLNIPLQGLGNLLYAAMVKHTLRRRLVLAQVASALARVAAMLGIAITTQSALALAAGLLVMSGCLVLLCSYALRGRYEAVGVGVIRRRPVLWATQSLSQMLALQADYLVLSVLANPAVLGLYFFSYQVTVALTAIVSPALSRTAMAEMATSTSQEARLRLAVALQQRLGLATAAMTALAAVVVVVAAPLLPTAWTSARELILVLLLSIPARLANPLTDSLQMASGRWRRSSAYNGIDATGTAAAASMIMFLDIFWVSLTIALWKAVWSGVRIHLAFRPAGWRVNSGVSSAPVVFALVTASGLLCSEMGAWPFVAGVVAVAVVYGMTSLASLFEQGRG